MIITQIREINLFSGKVLSDGTEQSTGIIFKKLKHDSVSMRFWDIHQCVHLPPQMVQTLVELVKQPW